MGSSREYWQYARECARWAVEAKKKDGQDLYLEMAKAWTHIALVDAMLSGSRGKRRLST
jgi:hypothetical protein